ncbi:MAG: BrnT family toxin [Proteobacteria bacterium]|nr:BrnT family toxin [Pseudomonadota bacterium]MCL2308520.1 BrnT family toxin [Pseudomonadota bacterium]
MTLRFEWDPAKNLANQRKHGLSFEEAAEAFRDPFLFTVQNRIEGGEYRWQAYGTIRNVVLVIVAHTIREDDDATEIIRIISARYATPKERRRYAQENG